MYKVSHNQKHLADEFLANPFGPASPELQRVLLIFRNAPMAGKHVLICTKPFREWTLARLGQKRGDPVELIEDQVFTSLEDAERAVFRLRWKAHTGYDL